MSIYYLEIIFGGKFMQNCNRCNHPEIRDYGPEPFIFSLKHAATKNQNFRTTLWTGQDMQLTVMSISPRCDIGVEIHKNVDQFFYVESGLAKVFMGCCQNNLQDMGYAKEGDAIFIPAGTCHNIVNTGNCPLKVFSVYAPPQHPYNTVHPTKEEVEH